jgi:hypothetical protein
MKKLREVFEHGGVKRLFLVVFIAWGRTNDIASSA